MHILNKNYFLLLSNYKRMLKCNKTLNLYEYGVRLFEMQRNTYKKDSIVVHVKQKVRKKCNIKRCRDEIV